MPLTLSDLSTLEDTLALKLQESQTAVFGSVNGTKQKTRKRMHETLETTDLEAVDRLDRLRLFQKLLINIRLNQSVFDDSHLDLRVNQLRAVEALAQFLANDVDERRSGYFKQPTGAGKTVLFGVIARLLGVRTLVLVPRTNLVDQTVDELVDVVGFSTSDIGRVGAGHHELGCNLTVATYQSHLSRMARDPEYREWVSECELVICDEAHRSLGKRTVESIDELDEEFEGEYDDEMTEEEEADENAVIDSLVQSKTKALKLGFTATPRLAGKNVGERFGTCIATETHADLVAANILVSYRLVPVDGKITNLDLEGTFTEEKETKVLRRNNTYRQLADEYAAALRAYNEKTDETPYPMRGVAFCLNIPECDEFMKQAIEVGLRARVVTGREAKGKKGDEVIHDAERQLLNNEIDLIVTVAKLGEGWNFPPANAAIWARAALSEAAVVQGIGRTARAHFDAIAGMRKPFAYVFETRWKLQSASGRRRTRKPLSIADALARNGEDPTKICQNADKTPLKYDKPITREELTTILTTVYTPETWAKLERRACMGKNFAGTGIGLKAIASVFGIEGDIIGYIAPHHALGRAIWPDTYGDPEEKERERIRGLITALYTPDTWMRLTQKQRQGSNVAESGYGFSAIATLFGVEGDPRSNPSAHHALGRAIWPDTYGDPEEKERERIRGLITALYTPETWMKLTTYQRQGANFAGTGLGICAIATIFGIEGNAQKNNSIHHALGKLIWLDNMTEAMNKERVRMLISQMFTPETWAKLTGRQVVGKNFAGTGLGLNAIATLFGVEGDPTAYTSARHALGRAIWPDTYGDPEKKERERIRGLITALYTPEIWVKLESRQREGNNFAGTGLGLHAIASLFEIEGRPTQNNEVYHALGLAIWPDTYGDPEEKERERIRGLITALYTPEIWVTLTCSQRKGSNFAGTGLGIKAIANLFQIEGNPVSTISFHCALGRAIFGEHQCFNR